MSKDTYSQALSAVLREEGGKVDDPRDPGGRTNQGIIQRVYDAYRKRKGLATRDVYIMENRERDEIYRQSYWNLIKGDDLPPGIDLAVFDGAVNSGPARSVKWLQQALDIPADGIVGPATLHALEEATDPEKVITAYMDARLAFLRSLKTFKTFGRGWSGRCARIEEQAVAMANGEADVPAIPATDAAQPPKPKETDVKKAPAKGLGDVATGVGVGAGGLSQVINSTKDQLEPYAGASQWVSRLVIGLVVVAGILTLGGLAWRAYAMWKADKLKRAV